MCPSPPTPITSAEAPGVCDLMRFSNGDGALALPEKPGSGGAATVWLRNLAWRGAAGAKGRLVVDLYTEHGDLTEAAAVSVGIDDLQNAAIEGKALKITVEQSAGGGDEQPHPQGAHAEVGEDFEQRLGVGLGALDIQRRHHKIEARSQTEGVEHRGHRRGSGPQGPREPDFLRGYHQGWHCPR